MTNEPLRYDNPDNDPVYDEWFYHQVDKACGPFPDEDDKDTGSFKKMAEVERRLKKKKSK